jgi:hypothetical protein
MQQPNTNINARHVQFYAGQAWDELQKKADELGQRYTRKRLTDAERLDFIEKSSHLQGCIQTAQRLVPEIRRRHREGLERNFAHMLNNLQRLEAVPGIAPEDRSEAQQEAIAIVGLLDAGEEPAAEERIRLLDQRIEELAMDGMDRDIESRLTTINQLLESVA